MKLLRTPCVCLYCSERRLWHVTEELFSLIFVLHLSFVPRGTSRAHASVSHSEVGWHGSRWGGMGTIDVLLLD